MQVVGGSPSSPLLSSGIVMLRDMGARSGALSPAPPTPVVEPTAVAATDGVNGTASAPAAPPAAAASPPVVGLQMQRVALPLAAGEKAEAPPPAPFEWIPGDYM